MTTSKPAPGPVPKPSPASNHRRRALAVLAGSPDGCTKSLLMAHGFTTKVLADLVRTELATARRECVGRGRAIKIVRLRISDAGREELA
jgi:hypothetical protein